MKSITVGMGAALLAIGAVTFAAQDEGDQSSNAGMELPSARPTTPPSFEPREIITKNRLDAPLVLPTGGPVGTLYFSEDNNGNGLYTLDQATGFANNIGISGVTSFTVGLAPGGALGILYGSKWSTLLHINANGSGALDVGGVGTEGLAFDGSTLYGQINGSFFTVDPATGANTGALAAPPGDMEGIAFGNGGVYGIVGAGSADPNLYFYNPVNDAWFFVGNTGVDWNLPGLAYNALTNRLYAKGSQDTLLYRINPLNGATVSVGDTGLAAGGGLAWLPPAGGGAPILYGLSSTSLGRLYTIDAAGAATLQTGLNGDASFTGITFLNNILYGTDLINYPGNTGNYDIGRIEPATGVITFLSDQDGATDWHGLASNESTGEMYAIDISDSQILKIQRPDGTIMSVGGGTGIDGRGMAFDDANQILYATDSTANTLHRVNVNTGTSALIGSLGVDTAFRLGLAYDEINQRLYMNVGGAVNALYLVNTVTGAASFVGPNGVTAIDGLAWRPPFQHCDKVLYGAANGLSQGIGPSTFYQIDPANGSWFEIGPIGFDNVTGLSFAPDGTLYASANGDAIFGEPTSLLIVINRLTGAGSLVGIIGQSSLPNSAARMPDISFSPDGILYGYGDSGTEGLYRIALGGPSPLGTFVGPTGFTGGGNGMDFDGIGRLFATPFDDNCLVRINVATGAGVCVAGTEGNVPSRVNALDFCEDSNQLYGSWNNGDERFLITLDLESGLATSVSPTVQGLDAIAFLCPAGCPWDLNGNGAIEFGDLLIVLSTWGFCPGCPADFNGNGFVDFNDLLKLLSNWGPCPGNPAPCEPPGACGFYVECAPGCFCFTLADGSGFCGGNFLCGDTEPCVDGVCPEGFVCQINTCCPGPICVPEDTACTLSPGDPVIYPVVRTTMGVVGPDGTFIR